MSKLVFDASALLAICQDEAGSEKALSYLSCAMMSCVNISEVIYTLIRNGFDLSGAKTQVFKLVENIVAYDQEQAIVTAAFKSMTSKQGLSFGDCSCLALGYIHKCKIITADKNWKKLDIDGLNIELIR